MRWRRLSGSEQWPARIMRLVSVGVIILGLSGIAIDGADLRREGRWEIAAADAARHHRFYEGADRAFWAESYDLSGVGHAGDAARGTLISDRHFLAAAHAAPRKSLTFYETNDKQGPAHTYAIRGGTRIDGTDLWLGELETPIQPEHAIRSYPIAWLPRARDFVGREIALYTYNDWLGRNRIERVSRLTPHEFQPLATTSPFLIAHFDPAGAPRSLGVDEMMLGGGDSGAPSFIATHDQLLLAGIHSFIYEDPQTGDRGSGDSLIAAHLERIDELMGDQSPQVRALKRPVPAP